MFYFTTICRDLRWSCFSLTFRLPMWLDGVLLISDIPQECYELGGFSLLAHCACLPAFRLILLACVSTKEKPVKSLNQ